MRADKRNKEYWKIYLSVDIDGFFLLSHYPTEVDLLQFWLNTSKCKGTGQKPDHFNIESECADRFSVKSKTPVRTVSFSNGDSIEIRASYGYICVEKL